VTDEGTVILGNICTLYWLIECDISGDLDLQPHHSDDLMCAEVIVFIVL
jgi:hypothetical protein